MNNMSSASEKVVRSGGLTQIDFDSNSLSLTCEFRDEAVKGRKYVS